MCSNGAFGAFGATEQRIANGNHLTPLHWKRRGSWHLGVELADLAVTPANKCVNGVYVLPYICKFACIAAPGNQTVMH